MIVGGSTSIGLQDIVGRMAHEPGVTERARLSILGGPLHLLKASTFIWPSSSSLLAGSAIPTPPAPALAVDINRDAKTDRLALAVEEPLEADPFVGAGETTPASLAGSGIASTGTASPGTGTGAPDAFAGTGTDPYEDGDVPDVAIEAEGLYSVPAGDPTGDPSQLEHTGPAVALGTEGRDITVPGDGALAAMDEDGPDGSTSSIPTCRSTGRTSSSLASTRRRCRRSPSCTSPRPLCRPPTAAPRRPRNPRTTPCASRAGRARGSVSASRASAATGPRSASPKPSISRAAASPSAARWRWRRW